MSLPSILTRPSSATARHRRASFALGAFCVIGSLAGASAAQAARPRPVPLPAPSAPVIVDVVDDDAITATFRVTNPYEAGVETVVRSVVGPCQPGVIYGCGPNGWVDVSGFGRLTGLQPASTYTVTVERVRFYDTRTNRAVSVRSAPSTFTVTTLTLEEARPSAPSIAETRRTTFNGQPLVAIGWAPSTDNTTTETELRYVYRIASDPLGREVPTCSQYCFGATGTTVPAPAPGTSISVTVTAIDATGNRSLPSNTLVISG